MSWIIGFFLKNWLKVVIVGAVLGFLGVVYQTGYNNAWRKAEAETKQTEIDTLKRDLDIARIQRAEAEKQREALETANQRNQDQINALEQALQNRPADAGRGLTELELNSLLGIE